MNEKRFIGNFNEIFFSLLQNSQANIFSDKVYTLCHEYLNAQIVMNTKKCKGVYTKDT